MRTTARGTRFRVIRSRWNNDLFYFKIDYYDQNLSMYSPDPADRSVKVDHAGPTRARDRACADPAPRGLVQDLDGRRARRGRD
ncbi:MAG: DUF3768 domain-containing protein [Xanthobacteraceae bacterium]